MATDRVAEYEAADAEVKRVYSLLHPSEGLGAAGVAEGTEAPPREYDPALQEEMDRARERFLAADSALGALVDEAGTQGRDRIFEEIQRRKDRKDKLEKKLKQTLPNYDEWTAGNAAYQTAQSSRDTANLALGAAGRFRGEAGSEAGEAALVEARKVAKEAKEKSKEAKKAAKKAKDAAKYGTKKEAEAAAAEAERLAYEAETLASDAARLVEGALTRTDPEDGAPSGAKTPPPTGEGPPANLPVPHGVLDFESKPQCGGLDPMKYCLHNCPEGCAKGSVRDGKCVCVWSKGGLKEGPGGGKGRGGAEATPPDSAASTPDARATRLEEVGPGTPPVVEPSPDAGQPTAPEPAAAAPPDGEPPVDAEDAAFARKMSRKDRELERQQRKILSRLESLDRKSQKYLKRLATGGSLSARDEVRLASVLREVEVAGLSFELVSDLRRTLGVASVVGMTVAGKQREEIVGFADVLVDTARDAREVVEAALQRQQEEIAAAERARRVAGRGYTDEDFKRAEGMLTVAWTEAPGWVAALGDQDADDRRTMILRERDAVERLGVDLAHTSATEVAQRLFAERRDAEMVAADEAARLRNVALRQAGGLVEKVADPVGRGLAATEKLIEAAVTGLQTLSTAQLAASARLLKEAGLDIPFFAPETFGRQARAQAGAFLGSLEDVWRNVARRDLDKVRNRITDATLGTATLHRTAEEHLYGSDPFLDFARSFAHFNTAAIQVTGAYLLGGAPGGSLGSVAGNARALAAVRAAGSSITASIKRVATTMPRTVKGWIEAARSQVSVHGGAAGRSTLREVAEGVAGAGRWKRTTVPWKYGEVPIPGADAMTDWLGQITIRPGIKGKSLIELFRHERVHRLLSPTSGPFRAFRATWKGRGYKYSHLLKYTEEALASGSVRYPFQYPGVYGISGWRLAGEVGLTGVGLGGAYYGGRELGEIAGDQIFGVGDGE
jgi:hypothetical protein